MEKEGETIRFLPEGKKARQCPIREASIRREDDEGILLELKVKSTFDPGLIIDQVLPKTPLKARVRRL
jgi:hypothetical protein